MLEQLSIRCRGLAKSFGSSVALQDFNLDVWDGSLIGLLGPSGCGKTTALRTIAGFERPDAGVIEIGEEVVSSDKLFLAPEQRNIGMVFQEYALFPHMDVRRNVAFGVNNHKGSRVDEVLEMVGLNEHANRMPHELSGGQQQRVALARALAPSPDVILLDEPFSNLDASLREQVRRDVRSILREASATAVFVTHDQEEALALSDIVAVMRHGSIVQAATPDEVYLRPATRWVAGFVGDADFVKGEASNGSVGTILGRFPTTEEGSATVMVRPESVRLERDASGAGTVIDREFFGHDQLYTVRLETGETLRARTGPVPVLARDDRVRLHIESVTTFAN
jgi:iron(III) transport system ATP-binding protein